MCHDKNMREKMIAIDQALAAVTTTMEARQQAINSLEAYLQELEAMASSSTEQWNEINTMMDRSFNNHIKQQATAWF